MKNLLVTCPFAPHISGLFGESYVPFFRELRFLGGRVPPKIMQQLGAYDRVTIALEARVWTAPSWCGKHMKKSPVVASVYEYMDELIGPMALNTGAEVFAFIYDIASGVSVPMCLGNTRVSPENWKSRSSLISWDWIRDFATSPEVPAWIKYLLVSRRKIGLLDTVVSPLTRLDTVIVSSNTAATELQVHPEELRNSIRLSWESGGVGIVEQFGQLIINNEPDVITIGKSDEELSDMEEVIRSCGFHSIIPRIAKR